MPSKRGGDGISLRLVDQDGEAIELEVSASEARAIVMTLPQLLNNSLKEKYRDDSLRYVFPLDGWQVEASPHGAQVIVTLTTGEGYEVSFAILSEIWDSLGSALRENTNYPGAGAVPVSVN